LVPKYREKRELRMLENKFLWIILGVEIRKGQDERALEEIA
jgi:hypothetical protein